MVLDPVPGSREFADVADVASTSSAAHGVESQGMYHHGGVAFVNQTASEMQQACLQEAMPVLCVEKTFLTLTLPKASFTRRHSCPAVIISAPSAQHVPDHSHSSAFNCAASSPSE
eukprot:2489964-Karenia_brevis.AAC.1